MLDNMSRIMQNDYKSAVQTAIQNPPKRIRSMMAHPNKTENDRIASENNKMLNRLMDGRSNFSV